ncbi:hypothetical protein A2415_02440 [candidate division WWE3 bacterium RIFOXYC1_FULL_39_7]|uniref:Aminotransferase DegT n=2 Tax=Katanobacteria TaxID=422282 RepID=A0A1F4X7E5_UNCKA|nr:MAG: hypothetical protein A2415_02440 [candidate division WWE3 bacterium RIFOXYC1_FULL_39_7]OGC77568.1 MAG: hypothetical protein A2619_01045 [candidate division WWE3 bacterium RIFOXYD1_FULL_39_9]
MVFRIPIAKPYISGQEINAVTRVLKSGMIARGKEVEQLEQNYRDVCGTKYSAATSSGTAALHSSMYGIGLGKGDEVITTPFTFVATVHPIIMLGAKPVFADIDPLTYNIDPKSIEKVLTKKTKAIVTVDLYGQPADYKEINKIARANDLVVVEDAAQAIGATYGNKSTGALGDIGCFSMYATKNITTGEGGMITTNNAEFYEKAYLFRHHGQIRGKEYEYEDVGYNYELSDIAASIGNVQISKLAKITKKRQKIAALYDKAFKNITGLVTPFVGPNRTHVYHQYTLRVTKDFPMNRDAFGAYLRERGIGCRVYYPEPLHRFKNHIHCSAQDKDLPNTVKASQEVLSIPCHPNLTDEEVRYIINTIKNI